MFSGIMPPVPTPFINNEVAYDKLSENIHQLNSFDLSGYVALGSNGESAYLSKEEKLKVIKKIKEAASTDKKIIAGTASDCIKDTIELSNKAATCGVDAALILTPSFYKSAMNHAAFINYFNEIANNVEIPVLIYNVPKFTGVTILANTVAELASHKNIVGIKNSSDNLAELSEIINSTPDDFDVIVGTASVLYPGLCVGAVGGILALANLAPLQCIEINQCYRDGEYDKACSLQLSLLEANRAVTAKYGVAGLKKAMDLMGYFGGDPRKPLVPFDSNFINDLQRVLVDAHILK